MSSSLGVKLGGLVRLALAAAAATLLPACAGEVDLSTPDPSITLTTPSVPGLPGVTTTIPSVPTTLPVTLPPVTRPTLPPLPTTVTSTSTTTAPPDATSTTQAVSEGQPPAAAASEPDEAHDDDWEPCPPMTFGAAFDGFGAALGSSLFLLFAGIAGAVGAIAIGLFALPMAGCGAVFFPVLPIGFFLAILLTALLGVLGFVVAMVLTYVIARLVLRPRLS